MAGGAGGWELRGQVIRIGHSLVIGLMTRVAIRWCAGENIVDMTLRAGDAHMGAGQREWCLAVIKGCWRPCRRGVTHIASCWEPGGRVVRIIGAVVVALMAGSACVDGQIEVAVRMTRSTLQRRVETCQWESSGRVIKCGQLPAHRRVADAAVCGETTCFVVRIRSAVVVLQVA